MLNTPKSDVTSNVARIILKPDCWPSRLTINLLIRKSWRANTPATGQTIKGSKACGIKITYVKTEAAQNDTKSSASIIRLLIRRGRLLIQ